VDRDAISRARLVKNEQAARAYNNRRLGFELEDGIDPDDDVPFLCECGDKDCAEALEMSPEEFVEVHSAPNRFAVLPGHVLGEVEWVIETRDRYWVIQKRAQAMAAGE
jgi:hypothetical protein